MKKPIETIFRVYYGIRRFHLPIAMFHTEIVTRPNWFLIIFTLFIFSTLIIIIPLPLKIVALIILIMVSIL